MKLISGKNCMTERRAKRRLMNEINVVPYIDVMLVLLIIFMITAPLINPGQVELPQIESHWHHRLHRWKLLSKQTAA